MKKERRIKKKKEKKKQTVDRFGWKPEDGKS